MRPSGETPPLPREAMSSSCSGQLPFHFVGSRLRVGTCGRPAAETRRTGHPRTAHWGRLLTQVPACIIAHRHVHLEVSLLSSNLAKRISIFYQNESQVDCLSGHWLLRYCFAHGRFDGPVPGTNGFWSRLPDNNAVFLPVDSRQDKRSKSQI